MEGKRKEKGEPGKRGEGSESRLPACWVGLGFGGTVWQWRGKRKGGCGVSFQHGGGGGEVREGRRRGGKGRPDSWDTGLCLTGWAGGGW